VLINTSFLLNEATFCLDKKTYFSSSKNFLTLKYLFVRSFCTLHFDSAVGERLKLSVKHTESSNVFENLKSLGFFLFFVGDRTLKLKMECLLEKSSLRENLLLATTKSSVC
jgi:hypothetical protein